MNDLDGLRLGADAALFLDFDGTLAEIGPDPDVIVLPPPTSDRIEALSRRLGGALVVLSGRDLRDLARRTPEGVWRAGGHGLEIAPPGAALPAPPKPAPRALLDALAPARAVAGVRIEVKGPVVAIHFRSAPAAAPLCWATAEAALATAPGYRLQAGKMVFELKPEGADKGTTLRRLAERAPFSGRTPVMLGDDTTDEDAMRAALELGGVAVKVGDGDTVAGLRTPDPAAVRAWIAREAAG